MAFGSPSIGDILMLSQLAWKIGCAFTAGRAGAPAQFQEVENELKSLTNALTLLAGTLDEDNGLFAGADPRTQEGLGKILGSASQSLNDLEAFVSQYQEIERPNGAGGAGVKRSWRQVLVRNYRTVMWTTEGGSIDTLKKMLAVHTQSISLAMQALQTRSLTRVENTVEPLAQQFDILSDRNNGNLDAKVDNIHDLMQSLQVGIHGSSPKMQYMPSGSLYPAPLQIPNSAFAKENIPIRPSWADEEESIVSPNTRKYGASPRISEPGDADPWGPSPTIINSRGTQSPGTLTGLRRSESHSDTGQYPSHSPYSYQQSPSKYDKVSRNNSLRSYGSPVTRFSNASEENNVHWSGSQALNLPPPAIPPTSASYLRDENVNGFQRTGSVQRPGSRPGQSGRSSLDTSSDRQQSVFSNNDRRRPSGLGEERDRGDSLRNSSRADSVRIAGSARQFRPISENMDLATPAEQAAFVRDLFINAAVLSDIPAASVDYTQPDEKSPGDWLMTNACGECKIYVITKGQVLNSGKTRFVTSVWSISNDRSVRLQQKLPVDQSIIPYTVWGNEKSVVLRVPAGLKYHDTSLDGKPIQEASTSWVSYVFANEKDAATFQTALMDKTILLSIKTKRTMRIFDGIKAPFAFAEQLCGLENLRVVANHDTGVVSAMLHYSPSFTEGYMEFPLNSLAEDIRIKDEVDTNFVRVKGLKIPVPKKPSRRTSAVPSAGTPESPIDLGKTKTIITGAKIEFSSAADKRNFMAKFNEVREAKR